MIQDAQGWCTGMTQRDSMGREVGGGFRMGNTCTPMGDSYQCMAKPIQYCKVKINKTEIKKERKGRGTRDQTVNIHWIIEKAREFQKNIYFCFIDYAKAFDCVNHDKLENSERDGNTRPLDLPLEKPI